MDIKPYEITYLEGGIVHLAQVKPCCGEDNVVDYGIYINHQLSFNVTRSGVDNNWVISLKNADRNIDDDVVRSIGQAIDQHTTE